MVARFVVLLVALAALALAAVERLAEDAAARGFFDEGIAWVPLTKGKALAKELQKPMVLCAKANGGLTMPAAQLVLGACACPRRAAQGANIEALQSTPRRAAHASTSRSSWDQRVVTGTSSKRCAVSLRTRAARKD